ncbi:hypothetical protein ACERII_25755, partial [Evansella sp. AB-rgal1]|uniref:hypothetical protein n=1 Tax=Evansella sp. AB-rgal1 TaxID=3242696 RepID=UPI00359EBE10
TCPCVPQRHDLARKATQQAVPRGNKPIMPLTPYQDCVLTGNGVAQVFMSEVAQCYVSKNKYPGTLKYKSANCSDVVIGLKKGSLRLFILCLKDKPIRFANR